MFVGIYRLATKIGFTFPHLPKRWNYKKSEIIDNTVNLGLLCCL
jgi:hypothetical protein